MKSIERVGWVALLLTVSFWGARRGSADGSSTKEAITVVSPANSPARGTRSRDAIHRHETRSEKQGSARSASPAVRAKLALGNDDPLQRLSRFLDVLSSCDAGELDKVMTMFGELRDSGIQLPVEEKLLHFRAGQLKGRDLLAVCTGSALDRANVETLKAQYQGWLHSDRLAAAKWLDTLPAGKFRDRFAVAAIAATASDDPAEALRQAATLHPSKQKLAGQTAAARLMESGALESATAAFGEMAAGSAQADSPYLSGVFTTLLTKASQSDQDMAAALAEANVHQPYADASSLAKVSTKMAARDPAGALEWALKMERLKMGELPDGELMTATIRGMTLDHLAEAEAWGAANASQPGFDRIIAELERRRNALEDMGSDDGDYDRDD